MLALLESALSGRYAIERELGRGGMASVWLARDLRHDRPVAVKVLHPELAGAIGVDRFVREIRLTAHLQHANIVPVFDSGTFTGPNGVELPWYAMAYFEGESLRTRLERERQLPIDEALAITGEAAAALAAAHQAGIVHRDIKPENILLAGGRAYVADFGIAKAVLETGGERLTSSGLIVGTPAYMSPEQATGDLVDVRTDQYSLASVLYEMLAGEPPFTGRSPQAIMARRMSEPARPIQPVRSSVPEAVEAALQRALQRVPADRFPTISDFAKALAAPAGNHDRAAGRRPAGLRVRTAVAILAIAGTAGWLLATRPRAAPRRVVDPEVVRLFEQGREAYRLRTPAGARDAEQALTAAIRLDSSYAPAWAMLARAYVQAYGRWFRLGMSRDSMLRLAVFAANRAVALDPQSGDAWIARGVVSRQVDPTDLRPVMASIRRGLALDSTHAAGWHNLALALGEQSGMAAAIPAWRRAVALNPRYEEAVAFLAMGHYWQRRYDSAATWADSSLALDPTYLLGRSTSGFIAASQGNFARARAAFEAAHRMSTDVEAANSTAGIALAEAGAGDREEALALLAAADSQLAEYKPMPAHSTVYFSQAAAALGDLDRALRYLRAYGPRADMHFQLHLRCDPPFDRLAGDVRFKALLMRPRPGPQTGC